MKKAIFLAVFMGMVLPHIALASWYNPFSWSIFHWFDKPRQVELIEVPDPVSTSTAVVIASTTPISTPKVVPKRLPVPTPIVKVDVVKPVIQPVVQVQVQEPPKTVVEPVDNSEFLKNMKASEEAVKQNEIDRLRLARLQSVACITAKTTFDSLKDLPTFALTAQNGIDQAKTKTTLLNAEDKYETACNEAPSKPLHLCAYYPATNEIRCDVPAGTCNSVNQYGACVN